MAIRSMRVHDQILDEVNRMMKEYKTRDFNRIDRILKLIEFQWKTNPDLRLCQLICNLSGMKYHLKDIFYVEDDIIEKKLKEWDDNNPETV
jgi:uncharacterized protein YihD (DUF1040 family)